MSLVRQRIQYLIEYGGIYPPDEPASKNFVFKWLILTSILICVMTPLCERVVHYLLD